MREYLHFMVGNVPDNDVSRGTTLAPYMGSAPPKDSGALRWSHTTLRRSKHDTNYTCPFAGLHRYILLVYKQTGYIEARQLFIQTTPM